MFRLEMRRIRLSNLFHSVVAAKLRDLSKNVLEQFLLSGGITNNKSSLAERVADATQTIYPAPEANKHTVTTVQYYFNYPALNCITLSCMYTRVGVKYS